MGSVFDLLPFAAAAFAIPQFWPQASKLSRTRDPAGLSWAWATLTSVNNAAWFGYFLGSSYWTALVPSSAASTLSGVVALLLFRLGRMRTTAALIVLAWTATLATGYAVGGLPALGFLLTGAMAVQVGPSLWVAYRTARPTGISVTTWWLVLGELSCWLGYGLFQHDVRVIALGILGVTAGALMLARVAATRRAHRLGRLGANTSTRPG